MYEEHIFNQSYLKCTCIWRQLNWNRSLTSFKTFSQIAQYLLEQGADIDYKGPDGDREPALLRAVKDFLDIWHPANSSMFEFLLSSGADIDLTDRQGRSALKMAIEADDLDMVEYFVDQGADVNSYRNHECPMVRAAGRCRTKILKYLFSKGGDVNCRRSRTSFMNVLTIAMRKKCKEVRWGYFTLISSFYSNLDLTFFGLYLSPMNLFKI